MTDVVDDLSKAQKTNPEVPDEKRSPVKFIVMGMLVVVLAAGAWAYNHFRDRVSSDDAQVDAHITAVAPKIPGTVLRYWSWTTRP